MNTKPATMKMQWPVSLSGLSHQYPILGCSRQLSRWRLLC